VLGTVGTLRDVDPRPRLVVFIKHSVAPVF
jgi:hypothetical protein